MNLLHICSITNNKTSGISNVVPDHFINQKKHENVALLNCNKTRIERLKREKNVFYLDKIKNFDKLPKPFNHPDLVIFHGIYFFQYNIFLQRYMISKINNASSAAAYLSDDSVASVYFFIRIKNGAHLRIKFKARSTDRSFASVVSAVHKA